LNNCGCKTVSKRIKTPAAKKSISRLGMDATTKNFATGLFVVLKYIFCGDNYVILWCYSGDILRPLMASIPHQEINLFAAGVFILLLNVLQP
jgi:hypothetical protein